VLAFRVRELQHGSSSKSLIWLPPAGRERRGAAACSGLQAVVASPALLRSISRARRRDASNARGFSSKASAPMPRECRVDDAVIPDGLESEDRSQEQQGAPVDCAWFLLEAVAAQAQGLNDVERPNGADLVADRIEASRPRPVCGCPAENPWTSRRSVICPRVNCLRNAVESRKPQESRFSRRGRHTYFR